MAAPDQTFSIYRGDTLLIDATYRTKLGVAVNLTTAGIAIAAYLRGKDSIHYPIAVTFLAQTGKYRLSGNTSNWPLGRNQLIIRYTQDTVTRTAEPVTVLVEAI